MDLATREVGRGIARLPPPRTWRTHPKTGLITPVWTLRQVAGLFGFNRHRIYEWAMIGLIPASLYGTFHRGHLVSEHQLRLIGSVIIAKRSLDQFDDRTANNRVTATVNAMQKEWDNARERRCGGDAEKPRWERELYLRNRRAWFRGKGLVATGRRRGRPGRDGAA